jgi:hypothetical protein
MRFLITAAAIFASSALAAKYAAGDICHSNVECEENCIDKQYTVAEQNGGFVFVCDPGVGDPMQWYRLTCTSYDNSIDARYPVVNVDETRAACKTVGGTDCENSCLLSGKRSNDEELRSEWTKACGDISEAVVIVQADEEAAKEYC